MSDTCETVKVKHETIKEGVIINKEDFDPDVHELFDKPEKAAAKGSSKKAKE